MTTYNDTIRVVIPLTIRKRNGRPKILPPPQVQEPHAQNPHILKALGRAWAWQKRLESGEIATAEEIAKIEGVTERFVSRTVRLAFLSPDVLDLLTINRISPAATLLDTIAASLLPWSQQSARIFR